METDDLHAAWAALAQRLDRDAPLQWQVLRDGRLERARSHLRPLYLGQLAQLALGLAVIALAGALWVASPVSTAVAVAGGVLHAYGIVTLVAAGVVLARLAQVDYDAPVVAIQARLAAVRKAYVVGGLVAGLPWWVLWVVVLVVVAGLGGVDLVAHAPGFVAGSVAVGVAGLLGTVALQRWASHPSRPRLGARLDDVLTGASLRRAQARIDELARFGRE